MMPATRQNAGKCFSGAFAPGGVKAPAAIDCATEIVVFGNLRFAISSQAGAANVVIDVNVTRKSVKETVLKVSDAFCRSDLFMVVSPEVFADLCASNRSQTCIASTRLQRK